MPPRTVPVAIICLVRKTPPHMLHPFLRPASLQSARTVYIDMFYGHVPAVTLMGRGRRHDRRQAGSLLSACAGAAEDPRVPAPGRPRGPILVFMLRTCVLTYWLASLGETSSPTWCASLGRVALRAFARLVRIQVYTNASRRGLRSPSHTLIAPCITYMLACMYTCLRTYIYTYIYACLGRGAWRRGDVQWTTSGQLSGQLVDNLSGQLVDNSDSLQFSHMRSDLGKTVNTYLNYSWSSVARFLSFCREV